MDATYLRVKNWSKLQHYRNRRPPWIKAYQGLLEDGDFARLDEFTQWQLFRVWLVASRATAETLDEDGCPVPVVANDALSLQRSIQSLKKVPLAMLIREGWLVPVAANDLLTASEGEQPASAGDVRPLAARVQDASTVSASLLDREKERSKEVLVVDLQALPSYEGGPDEKLWAKLVTAAGARDAGSVRKLERAVTANRCTERDLVCAIEAADGPGVRDRLAVALAELVRRAGERAA